MLNQQELAAQEYRRRIHQEIARREFYSFCTYVDPGFFTPGKPHLKKIADAFQRVADGKLKKLAVSLPPRAGKSYITSMFCVWALGRNMKDAIEGKDKFRSIMRNSYAAKLAEKFSKDIRDGFIIDNPRVKEVFPWLELGRSTAIEGWSLKGTSQPSYFCAGVGGAITGFGCNLVAILDK